MRQFGFFDPLERRHAKAHARAMEDHALRNGAVSREDLRRRNSFLGSLEIVGSSFELQGNSL